MAKKSDRKNQPVWMRNARSEMKRLAEALRLRTCEAPKSPVDDVLEMYDAMAAELARLALANASLVQQLRAHVPCQACAWELPRAPEQSEEPPIVRGALDAQAAAEQALYDERNRGSRSCWGLLDGAWWLVTFKDGEPSYAFHQKHGRIKAYRDTFSHWCSGEWPATTLRDAGAAIPGPRIFHGETGEDSTGAPMAYVEHDGAITIPRSQPESRIFDCDQLDWYASSTLSVVRPGVPWCFDGLVANDKAAGA